jgi:hypothetical protein
MADDCGSKILVRSLQGPHWVLVNSVWIAQEYIGEIGADAQSCSGARRLLPTSRALECQGKTREDREGMGSLPGHATVALCPPVGGE